MKKFFSIAAIVLMAALLAVSCSDAAVSNDYVNATLTSNGAGRVMSISQPAADFFIYRLDYMTTAAKGEAGYGATAASKYIVAPADLKDTGTFNIGYISQGLWKITLEGYQLKAEQTAPTAGSTIDAPASTLAKKVCEGNTTANIDKAHTSFTLTLTASTGTGTLKMSGVTASGSSVTKIVVLNGETEVLSVTGTPTYSDAPTNSLVDYTTFSDTADSVTAGSWIATIKLYNGDDVVGTQMGAVTILDGQETVITGTTDAAKFMTPAANISGLAFTGTLEFGTSNAFAAGADKNNFGKTIDLKWTSTSLDKATTVVFYLNGETTTTLGTITASNGVATCSKAIDTEALKGGQYTISAVAYAEIGGKTVYTSQALSDVYYIY